MNQEEMIRDVRKRLFEMQDTGYRDFHARLIPTVEKEKIIGIRTPILRKFAKEFGKTEESELFLKVLPHQYYEEKISARKLTLQFLDTFHILISCKCIDRYCFHILPLTLPFISLSAVSLNIPSAPM